MHVVTLNLNRIRSAANKGFLDWMRRQEADIVCVQELRAQEDQCIRRMLGPKGYYAYWRIDYQIATPRIAQTATAESIYKRRRFSDHASLTIDYDYAL